MIKLFFFGNDRIVGDSELLVYQSKKEKLITIKQPVQMVIPFKLYHPNEHAEPHTNNNRPKRTAATNIDAIRRASDH